MVTNFSSRKRYGNKQITFTLLQTIYKSLGVFNLYARLTNWTMWEWFTKDGALKENYIQPMEHGTTKKSQIIGENMIK